MAKTKKRSSAVGETTDVIFGLMFFLMIILVNAVYFVDVSGQSVF